MHSTTILPVFDGHNDTILSLTFPKEGKARSFFRRSEHGHIDLPRAREAGLGGGMFAIFVRPDPAVTDRSTYEPVVSEHGYEGRMLPTEELSYSQKITIHLMAELFRLEAASAGQVKITRTVKDLETCFQQGDFAVVLHFEGAEPIDPDLDALYLFYQGGLRSLGLVWSRPNAFGIGVPFKKPGSPDIGPGLTDTGKALVRACNELGIVIDLAHLNAKGFWDVAKISHSPLVVSHTAAHRISPSARNLTNAQLEAVADSGGVVGITFCTSDLREDFQFKADAPISMIVRHIEYIADHIGVEHVALGSDFDGATIPQELGDVRGLPKLLAALREHGYDDDALRKITSENWFRVLRQTWKPPL